MKKITIILFMLSSIFPLYAQENNVQDNTLIGEINHQQGKFDQALHQLERSLTLREELGNPLYISETFSHDRYPDWSEKGDFVIFSSNRKLPKW